MPQIRQPWEPHEWQRWINQVLFARYGHDGYQRIPDKHSGDHGIEGFSRDGCAYQCYVAEEPVSTKELYERQRDKVHQDLQKFLSNSKELTKLFAGLKIRRWVLVVPRFESAALVEYCGVKSEGIRKIQLPYVSEEFTIHVCTDEAWPMESARLVLSGATALSIDAQSPQQEAVDQWLGSNGQQVQSLRRKAARLTKPSATTRFVQGSIRDHIKGQNAHEQLRTNFPEICDKILSIKHSVEEQLETDSTLDNGVATLTYKAVQEKFASRLKEQLHLSPQLVDDLTAEALADWLLRCPLDFYEDDDVCS
jgi:hypothetical protein